jgi:CheY-like chemotaxis protein
MAGRLVLLADAKDECRAVHRLILELAGYTVIEAETGRRAIGIARTRRPDAILLELSLPVVDGLEVTRRLRSRAATAATPIVMLTLSTDPRDAEEARRAGCDGYLVKPCHPQTLLAELLFHMRPRTLPLAAAPPPAAAGPRRRAAGAGRSICVQETGPERELHHVGAVAQPELLHQVVAVGVDRARR